MAELIPISICVILPVLIIITIYLFKFLEKNARLKTIEKALDKGIELSPEIFNDVKPEPKKKNAMRRFTTAMVLIGLGIALVVCLYLIVHVENVALGWGIASIGLIPMLIGFGLLISFFMERRFNKNKE